MAKKNDKTSAPKPDTKSKRPQSPLTDAQVIDLARDWARLHENPKTRDKMDAVVEGLSGADTRRVVLCGQRIRAGLTPRIAK